MRAIFLLSFPTFQHLYSWGLMAALSDSVGPKTSMPLSMNGLPSPCVQNLDMSGLWARLLTRSTKRFQVACHGLSALPVLENGLHFSA
jgi:hypothetical protein